jgi:hypothetical protein
MREADLAYRVGVQANGRFECELVGARIGQIERARIGIEALGDEVDDIAQGLPETVGSRNDLGNIGQ